MERAIDRTAYRRNTSSTANINFEANEEFTKKIRKFLYQILISALTFLCLTIVKKYSIQPIAAWAEESFNNQISAEEICKYAEINFLKLKEYIVTFGEKNISNIQKEDSISTDNSAIQLLDNAEMNEKKYEEAVEGVNQMIDDAEYIKAKYNLKHAIQGTVTSIFGVRESNNTIVTHYHSGIDVAANKGTNICASIGGEVITAATDVAYGKYIMVQTDDMVTLYAHCSELKVKKGQKVKQGEVIAKVGSTGWSTGPHLHFEIRLDGRLVNPADVLDYSKMGA